MELTESQKRLIMHLQYDFPVDVRPFSVIAEKLGLRERGGDRGGEVINGAGRFEENWNVCEFQG